MRIPTSAKHYIGFIKHYMVFLHSVSYFVGKKKRDIERVSKEGERNQIQQLKTRPIFESRTLLSKLFLTTVATAMSCIKSDNVKMHGSPCIETMAKNKTDFKYQSALIQLKQGQA